MFHVFYVSSTMNKEHRGGGRNVLFQSIVVSMSVNMILELMSK